ncbi:PHD finger protein 7-like [Metopolophium dirhodum]|uniref:PHD finger protein 7-like n=1 Tax=Metopolophium dirhodum TaxID=44670 RepID=UPI00298FF69E|nr:PHD finger protein 7-like [Metopolophium dirhodum]
MAPTTSSVHREAHTSTALQPYSQKVELNKSQKKKCMLCGHKKISQQLNGSLYMLNDVIVHYFCIMLSSKALKNGSDKEGIWGYLLNDIRAEILRGSRVTCVYCNKKGATLMCSEVRCRKLFHLPCGLINGSMHHYFSPFKSFCQQHRVQPVIDVTELPPFAYPTVECGICNDSIVPSASSTSIWVPCCRINGWFHRDCVQDLALRKGYFIECPRCENVDKFKSRILILGIYIPSRYHTWEKRRYLQNTLLNTLQNSFEQLTERATQCDAIHCLCPHEGKRNFQNEFGWKLVLCRTCGYRQTHVYCNSIRFDEKWDCTECQMVIKKITARQLEFPIDGNSVGISAVLGDFDSKGNFIPKQPYIPGYVQRRE